MDHRLLGRSGTSVSTLCLGTMTFGDETDEAAAHEQLDVFLHAGGTLVDTADVYSAGVSEQIVAAGSPRALRTSATGSCSRPRAGSRWPTSRTGSATPAVT